MRKRVLIIGIDSLDSKLVDKFIEDLPNIRRLRENSPDLKLEGVFPPDSPTSWATIFTGLNPAKHGVLFFMDPLERTGKWLKEELSNSAIKGKTFWDLAVKNGKKVYVFFPVMGHPVWKVNGIFVGRATINSDVQMYPPLEEKDKLSKLVGLRGMPGRNPRKFINKGKKLMECEEKFAISYLNEDWDLFFFYSSVLDSMQHSFWNCFDRADPSYKEGNDYETVVLEFYKEYDRIVGEFIRRASSNTVIMLISDHGHMRRPVNIVNINRVLKEKGYFSLNSSGRSVKTSIYEKKSFIINIINKHRLNNLAIKVLRKFPNMKSLFTSPDQIDWENTIAYVSDLSGIKAYTYGGIVIKQDKLRGKSYEVVRDDIVNTLLSLKNPTTDERLIKWIKKREELYAGEFINKYPDIIFEFYDDYGAGWSFEDSLILPCNTHKIQTGCHKQNTPVLFMCDWENPIHISRNNATLMDVAPTILNLLGLDWKRFDFDGGSILTK